MRNYINVVVSHNYNFLQNFQAIRAEKFGGREKNSGLLPSFQLHLSAKVSYFKIVRVPSFRALENNKRRIF
jgi:hypothetical protein